MPNRAAGAIPTGNPCEVPLKVTEEDLGRMDAAAGVEGIPIPAGHHAKLVEVDVFLPELRASEGVGLQQALEPAVDLERPLHTARDDREVIGRIAQTGPSQSMRPRGASSSRGSRMFWPRRRRKGARTAPLKEGAPGPNPERPEAPAPSHR